MLVYVHVHKYIHMFVPCAYTLMIECIFMYMAQTHSYWYSADTSVQFHNNTSLPILPNQPCNTGESQLSSGSDPSEQLPSCHHSLQMTDHQGAVQTATATGLPHTLCCHACHLQCPALDSKHLSQATHVYYPQPVNYQGESADPGWAAAVSVVKSCCNSVVCFDSAEKVIFSSSLSIPSTAAIYLQSSGCSAWFAKKKAFITSLAALSYTIGASVHLSSGWSLWSMKVDVSH